MFVTLVVRIYSHFVRKILRTKLSATFWKSKVRNSLFISSETWLTNQPKSSSSIKSITELRCELFIKAFQLTVIYILVLIHVPLANTMRGKLVQFQRILLDSITYHYISWYRDSSIIWKVVNMLGLLFNLISLVLYSLINRSEWSYL